MVIKPENRFLPMRPTVFSIIYPLALALTMLIVAACEDNKMGNPLPSTVADFSYTSSNGFIAPSEITFTNKSILATSYHWDFGDGQTSTNPNPVHIYTDPGTYLVQLVVTPTHQLYYNRLTKTATIIIKDPLVALTKRLYFTDRTTGKAHFVYLTGGTPVIQNFTGGGFYKPYGITATKINQKVYVTDIDGYIYGFTLDGENQEFILKGTENPLAEEPYGIIVVGEHIYWAGPGGIFKADLDGKNATTFAAFSGPPELPLGMAYDSIGKRIFFVNDKYEYSGGVWSINIDGTGLTQVIPGVDAGAIALDLINNKMYYADWEGGVFSANLDGTGITNINNSLNQIFVWGIAVNPQEGKVYVSDKTNKRIIRMNLDGSQPENWITNVNPYAMYIFDPLM